MIYSEESGHKTIGMTGFQIKMLGIVLMVLDHVHQMFAPLGIPEWFTMLGRAVARCLFSSRWKDSHIPAASDVI